MFPIVILCSTLPPIVSTKQHLSFIYTDIGIDNIEWLRAYALVFNLGSDTYCTKSSASLYTSAKSNFGDQGLSEVEKVSFIALLGKEGIAGSCLEKQYVSNLGGFELVKKLPAMGEMWVQSLGWEDPLVKGKASRSSILAWRIPWTV